MKQSLVDYAERMRLHLTPSTVPVSRQGKAHRIRKVHPVDTIGEGERKENAKFANRLHFTRSKFWTKEPEPRSLIPSIWPRFEEAVRKWGIPSSLMRIPWYQSAHR